MTDEGRRRDIAERLTLRPATRDTLRWGIEQTRLLSVITSDDRRRLFRYAEAAANTDPSLVGKSRRTHRAKAGDRRTRELEELVRRFFEAIPSDSDQQPNESDAAYHARLQKLVTDGARREQLQRARALWPEDEWQELEQRRRESDDAHLARLSNLIDARTPASTPNDSLRSAETANRKRLGLPGTVARRSLSIAPALFDGRLPLPAWDVDLIALADGLVGLELFPSRRAAWPRVMSLLSRATEIESLLGQYLQRALSGAAERTGRSITVDHTETYARVYACHWYGTAYVVQDSVAAWEALRDAPKPKTSGGTFDALDVDERNAIINAGRAWERTHPYFSEPSHFWPWFEAETREFLSEVDRDTIRAVLCTPHHVRHQKLALELTAKALGVKSRPILDAIRERADYVKKVTEPIDAERSKTRARAATAYMKVRERKN
jgi:hypothetical protein